MRPGVGIYRVQMVVMISVAIYYNIASPIRIEGVPEMMDVIVSKFYVGASSGD
jgi:hypothetical protein